MGRTLVLDRVGLVPSGLAPESVIEGFGGDITMAGHWVAVALIGRLAEIVRENGADTADQV
jgi:hypothetical protein